MELNAPSLSSRWPINDVYLYVSVKIIKVIRHSEYFEKVNLEKMSAYYNKRMKITRHGKRQHKKGKDSFVVYLKS